MYIYIVYLPTCRIKTNQNVTKVGKYTIHGILRATVDFCFGSHCMLGAKGGNSSHLPPTRRGFEGETQREGKALSKWFMFIWPHHFHIDRSFHMLAIHVHVLHTCIYVMHSLKLT